MSDLSKVWFLTGASSNFGIALTRALLEAGHKVVATARTPSKLPFETHDALLVLPLDVTDFSSISQAFEDARRHFGRIDVVVNKAGFTTLVELEALSEDKARKVLASQLWGPARVQEIATELFEAQKIQGLILNITSVMAVFSGPLIAIMCAAKAGSEVLTLARARSSPFVTAVNIRPGGFEDHPEVPLEPQPPAFTSKDLGRTLAGTMRTVMSSQSPGQGDVRKMVRALIALAELSKEQLSGAVLLGSEAFAISRIGAMKRVANIQHGQRIINDLKKAGSQSKDARVWFVTGADSTLGRTIVRLLLDAGHRVAAVIPDNVVNSLSTNMDQLLVLRRASTNSVSDISKLLTEAAHHFGNIDVVINTPPGGVQSQQPGDWDTAYALTERIFWSPMNTASAAVKVLRETNPPGVGGRIFNVLTAVDADDTNTSSLHSALNIAVTAATTGLVRELPRKWNIGVSAIIIDPDLHADEETAHVLMKLVDLPHASLPGQLYFGDRAIRTALHAAQVELSEACSKDAMERAMSTDRAHIDSRARIGLFHSLLSVVLSPSPSVLSKLFLLLSALGWGIRMVMFESLRGTFTRS
ncbi:unnamed protein product [Peniophora sp. CBMAI 1063]|nr:unnamed protein product [Peniophora sp. CBMAI 1063]